MALYREDATGFVCEFAASPGAGYTLIDAQPTDTLTNRVNWWREVDKWDQSSEWHPSLQSGAAEVPGNDTRAGSGINIMPDDYSSFEWAGAISPVFTQTASYSRTAAAAYSGQYGVRLTLSGSDGYIGLASSSTTYNISIGASSKWIVSGYFRPTTAAEQTVTITLVTPSASYSVTGTTEDSSSTWKRISGVFDLSADTSIGAQIRISTSTTSASLDFDGIMLEEKVGPYSDPSIYYSPWGNGLSDDQFGDDTIAQSKLFTDLADRIDLIDNSLPGSVNARLASQYDTLVQQISEVAVGSGDFDSRVIWYFDQSSEITGWTTSNASIVVSGGYLEVTATGSIPYFQTAAIAVDGSAYQLVRLRVKRTAGTGWTGTLTYFYSSGSSTITISEPTSVDSSYVEASWDLTDETLWKSNTITGIRIQLGTSSGDNYSVDWLGVGRNAPGASYYSVDAVRVLADNKNRVFYATSAPSSDSNYTLKTNDLWFDSDDGYKPYRYNGSTWVETTDTRLATSWAEIYDIGNATASPSGAAAQRINGISATASSKIKTYYQASTSAPSSPVVGDIWFKTDLNNRAFRWNGSAWVETSDVRIVNLEASVANKEEAKVGYCTLNPGTNTTKAWCETAGGTWVDQPFATAVKQVSVTTTTGTATVEQNIQALATSTGALSAEYMVRLDVNGYVTGFGLVNSGTSSSFIVRSDKFIVGSASNNTTPFVVDTGTGVTYINIAAIKDATITGAKIANATISAAQIADASITSAKIADATIQSADIGDLQVTNAKIANLAVDSFKIASAAITTAKIGDAQITGAKIASATITSANIQDATITAADIANATITGAKIATATIATANIADAQITGAKIASATITTANIGDAQITNAKVASLDGGKITANTLDASKITAGTITADRITIGGVTTDRINSSAVTASAGYGSALFVRINAYSNAAFWTPNFAAVSYGRGNISFISYIVLEAAGIPFGTVTALTYEVQIEKSGNLIRTIRGVSPQGNNTMVFSVPVVYFDSTQNSGSFTYSFKFYNTSGYYVNVISLDEYWVEYKR